MYKILIFLIITFFSSAKNITTKNVDIEVYKDGNDFKLAALNCEEIEGEIKTLKIWAKKQYTPIKKQSCICQDGFCTINISSILPEVAKLYQDKRPDVDGPNCWNNTLVTAGILPHIRYTTPEEMSFWMNSPLCEEKKLSDNLNPGDVITIRESDGTEYHGFTYVSDKLAWSKNGLSKQASYKLQGLKNVFDTYEVQNECQRIYGNTSKKCKKFANVYKCKSWDEYWASVDESIKTRVDADLEKSLNTVECNLSENLKGNSAVDKQLLELMFDSVVILDFAVHDMLEKLGPNSTEEEKIYIDRAKYRILSIREQLNAALYGF